MIATTTCQSPLGALTLAAEEGRLIGLWLPGQKYFAAGIHEPMRPQDDLPIFMQAKAWLSRYFAGQRPTITELPLAPRGSDFQQAVWQCLCEIPYGQTTSYGQITQAIGCRSAQAVGGAVGRNPISIIVPCHRVIGSTGKLVGYGGGLDKKIVLLELERKHHDNG